MSKKNNDKWKLDSKDVYKTGSGLKIGGRKKATKSGRKEELRESTIILTHRQTGLSVSGKIERGHYSRQELRSLKENLENELFKELEDKVAKFLRIPGRW